ncbi:MAG: STAS domain-containing protein [Candidatus Krumholzibacteriia bacterium]|nr:STAS domain-containing protein [bacterium]MCB9514882.1 STAS domain-containing protein [Candidatus Latescibacterota bacterium]
MTLICEPMDGILTLRPADEWDDILHEELARAVRSRLATGGRSFLVDLAATTHIRFRVLSKLLDLHDEVKRAGGELVLAGPSFYLMEILAAGDVPRSIPVYPSEASAALGIRPDFAASSQFPHEGERRGSGLVF